MEPTGSNTVFHVSDIERSIVGNERGHSGFPVVGEVFESAVAVGKDFDGGEGFDRIQVDTGRGSR